VLGAGTDWAGTDRTGPDRVDAVGVGVGAVGAGDAASQQAFLAAGVEVGEQDRDGLAHDPAPVGRGSVTQQRKPGTFQVK